MRLIQTEGKDMTGSKSWPRLYAGPCTVQPCSLTTSCPAPRAPAPVAPQTDEDHGQSILNARVKALTTKKGTHTVSDQLDVIARRLVSTG